MRLQLSDDRILCLGLCAIAEYGLFFEVEAPTAVFQQEGRGYIREGAETFSLQRLVLVSALRGVQVFLGFSMPDRNTRYSHSVLVQHIASCSECSRKSM